MRKLKETEQLESRIIESKFGPIEISAMNEVNFPLGILGMPGCKSFHLIQCPIEKFSQFLLLQSGDDDTLVFMVLPINPLQPKYFKEEDLEEAYNQTGVKKQDASIVLIASTKENEEGKKLITVNTRAPIIIDTQKREAKQYVLQNNEYEVRQYI